MGIQQSSLGETGADNRACSYSGNCNYSTTGFNKYCSSNSRDCPENVARRLGRECIAGK